MLYFSTNYILITVFSDAKDNGDIYQESASDLCQKCDAGGGDNDNTTGVKENGTFRADFCAAAHTQITVQALDHFSSHEYPLWFVASQHYHVILPK